MLLVKTKIGPSDIEGTGLFADEFIPKGTIIWKYQDGFDHKYDVADIAKLSESAKAQFLKYTYFDTDIKKYILCFDDARFFNHSDTPNCDSEDSSEGADGLTIANRDIQPGEELLCDYGEFDSGNNTTIVSANE